MAVKSQHYLFTFHPIKKTSYIFDKTISAILITAIHIFQMPTNNEQTLNIADKALCVSDIFCGIHEILLLFNKITKIADNLMIQAGLDFHYIHSF